MRLCDFGLAKQTESQQQAAATHLSTVGVKGTAPFMDPLMVQSGGSASECR